MNLLVEKIKSATGGRAEDYASKHERTSEELQFVNEMIHNIGIEIETYQEEYAKMEPEGYRELVVGKILRRKSDENLVKSNIFMYNTYHDDNTFTTFLIITTKETHH